VDGATVIKSSSSSSRSEVLAIESGMLDTAAALLLLALDGAADVAASAVPVSASWWTRYDQIATVQDVRAADALARAIVCLNGHLTSFKINDLQRCSQSKVKRT
jgi:hypothetical protein